MTAPDILLLLIECLETLQCRYMLVGALSVNEYAVPRSTYDADVVVDLEPGQLAAIAARLQPHATLDRQQRLEMATGTRRNNIEVSGSDYRIELFHLSADPHDRERFARRVRSQFDTLPTWIPTAEDVIVWKLRWALSAGRGKDRDDVRAVIAVQSKRLDWAYIHRWCDEHGTRPMLDEIVTSIPPDLLA